jgi:hypothetical protein
MSATDAVKEVVRIAASAGLSKDVIEHLDKKAALLAEQVAVLETENATLLRENNVLKHQLQNARPLGDGLEAKTKDILKYFFDKANDISDEEIARHFGISLNQAGYHSEILFGNRFIQGTRARFEGSTPRYGITPEGRAYCVENGMAA